MDTLTAILFGALVLVGAVLFTVNVLVVVLRLSHRPTQAVRIASSLAPFAAYLRLGGRPHRNGGRSKHA